MPTKTFFNLSPEKQELLLEAAKREFKSYPLQEVSINRIINDAKIARGSFYMYFEDKEDLYCYFLEKEHHRIIRKVETIVSKSNGNLFIAIEDIYDYFSEKKLTEERKKYFNNIITSIHTSVKEKILTKNPMIKTNHILEKLDYNIFKCEKECAQDVIDATVNYLIRVLIKVLNGIETKEQGKKHIQNFIEVIKYGIYKEEKNAKGI